MVKKVVKELELKTTTIKSSFFIPDGLKFYFFLQDEDLSFSG